jgi:peptidoglycan/xylan/chitin deacetylase (PgdA/CDA1 family)
MLNLAATFLLALARRYKQGGVIINEHTLTQAQTRFHIQVLSRWFEFIKLADLPARLAQRTRKPFCLMTFDDGKRSNFTETAPELERLRVPAVFYVTTEPLTNGSCFWFDRREQLVRAIGRCPAGLDLDALKQLPFDALMGRLERACAECQYKPGGEPDDLRPMSWDEARSLNRRGFTLGAHGLTHAILTCETRERAFAEIDQSLARVTDELGAPCTTFAFPNGNYDTELLQHARRCGASTVMTTEPTWADTTSALGHLPRIQLFGGASRARIESKIAMAAFRGILANPNGSGRGYRHIPREGGAPSSGATVPEWGY